MTALEGPYLDINRETVPLEQWFELWPIIDAVNDLTDRIQALEAVIVKRDLKLKLERQLEEMAIPVHDLKIAGTIIHTTTRPKM